MISGQSLIRLHDQNIIFLINIFSMINKKLKMRISRFCLLKTPQKKKKPSKDLTVVCMMYNQLTF